MPERETIVARDGVRLVIHRIGEGRPVILLHGLFSDARMNWIKFGHAQAIADAGCEVIMPDLRAHGESGKPHEPAAYPRDVLIRDLADVVAHFDRGQYDLAGFSLGARTALQAVAGGMAPRRLAVAGMGLQGLSGWDQRSEFFRDAIDRFDEIDRGDPAFFAKAFMKTMNTDRVAARLLLDTMGDIDTPALSKIAMPTLVVCGTQDTDNGSAEALAEALPDGRFRAIPGTHMSSVAEPALGREIADFLSD